MNSKSNSSRITIDLPKESHRQLKAMAALLGKSMREIVIESLEKHVLSTKTPNPTTRTAIKNASNRKGLVKAKNAADLFKKLGI